MLLPAFPVRRIVFCCICIVVIVFCCNELFKFSYLSSVPLRRVADPSDSDGLASSKPMLNGRENKKAVFWGDKTHPLCHNLLLKLAS